LSLILTGMVIKLNVTRSK